MYRYYSHVWQHDSVLCSSLSYIVHGVLVITGTVVSKIHRIGRWRRRTGSRDLVRTVVYWNVLDRAIVWRYRYIPVCKPDSNPSDCDKISTAKTWTEVLVGYVRQVGSHDLCITKELE